MSNAWSDGIIKPNNVESMVKQEVQRIIQMFKGQIIFNDEVIKYLHDKQYTLYSFLLVCASNPDNKAAKFRNMGFKEGSLRQLVNFKWTVDRQKTLCCLGLDDDLTISINRLFTDQDLISEREYHEEQPQSKRIRLSPSLDEPAFLAPGGNVTSILGGLALGVHESSPSEFIQPYSVSDPVKTATLRQILEKSNQLFDNVMWIDYPGYGNTSTRINRDDFARIQFGEWVMFDEEKRAFYERPNVQLALDKTYPVPHRAVPSYCGTKLSVSAMLNEKFNQTINLYFTRSSLPNGRRDMMHMEYALINVKSDFWFADTTMPSLGMGRYVGLQPIMPGEVKRSQDFSVPPGWSLIEFMKYNDNCADPIYQLVANMNNSGSKYGILTTVSQTWVFKRENERFYLFSPAQPQSEWLKTFYFACSTAREYRDAYPGSHKPSFRIKTGTTPSSTTGS